MAVLLAASLTLPWATAAQAAHDLTREELAGIWADLAGADARTAYQGICKLIQSPGPSVNYLKEHLQPVRPADAGRIAKLIADLDSEQFAVRDKATKELEQLQELAEPALKQLLAEKPTLEVRQRASALLKKLAASSPERLRQVRAVEALEHMGGPGARHLLEALATGAPEAWLTKEAKASVERLRRLAAAKD